MCECVYHHPALHSKQKVPIYFFIIVRYTSDPPCEFEILEQSANVK
jgi:hypothetical protein